MRLQMVSALALGSLLAGAAFGQIVVQGTTTSSGTSSASYTFSGPPPFAMPAVTGAAYSGEEVNERVQTLLDGTHITQTMPGRRVFRDSQGRTRSERFLGAPGTSDGPTLVEITDPVAGFQYTLDTQGKVAHRFALPQPSSQPEIGRRLSNPQAAGVEVRSATGNMAYSTPGPNGIAGGVVAMIGPPPAASNGQPRPDFKTESLGTQTIDGVQCEGRRATTTYPTGSQGNDRPIVVTQETWMSPELKTTVLTKTSDPRSGEMTFKILNLSRTEPDASLFQPPPDYQVVDGTGPVTIDFKR
jgi:hypothetical protein